MSLSVHVCHHWLWLACPYLAAVAEQMFIGDPRAEISVAAQPAQPGPGSRPCRPSVRSWGTLPVAMSVGATSCSGLLVSVPSNEANLIRNLAVLQGNRMYGNVSLHNFFYFKQLNS
jgi:hypothetical protein